MHRDATPHGFGVARHRDLVVTGENRLAHRRRIGRSGPLATARPAQGQTLQQLQSLSVKQLSEIRISSVARRTEPLSDAPAAVYVISHQDIIRSGATTIPEILRLAPNLEVAQINSTSYAISARGFNVGNNASLSNKLLVMVNGRSVYSPMFGGVYWDMLERAAPEHRADRGDQRAGRRALGRQRGERRHQHHHAEISETQGGMLTLGAGTQERNASIQYGGRISPELTFRVHAEYTDFGALPGTPMGRARMMAGPGHRAGFAWTGNLPTIRSAWRGTSLPSPRSRTASYAAAT